MKDRWELLDNKGISFLMNNHDGLLWEVLINYKEGDRDRFIGKLTEEGLVPMPVNDAKFEYRMLWSEGKILFFRREK